MSIFITRVFSADNRNTEGKKAPDLEGSQGRCCGEVGCPRSRPVLGAALAGAGQALLTPGPDGSAAWVHELKPGKRP